ncbi:hypothetical protein ACWGCW_33375 [Streptomyces sp. NPDC054933]
MLGAKTVVNDSRTTRSTSEENSSDVDQAEAEPEIVEAELVGHTEEESEETKHWAAEQAQRIVKKHGTEYAGALYWALADEIYRSTRND